MVARAALPSNFLLDQATRLFSWSGSGGLSAATFANSNGASQVANTALGDSQALSLPYHASQASCDASLTTGQNLATVRTVQIQVAKSGDAISLATLYFGNGGGFATFMQVVFAVKPGTWTYTFSAGQFSGSGWGSMTNVNRVRIKDYSDAANYGYPTLREGESLLVGFVGLNVRSRPKLLIGADDGFATLVSNGASYPTGYPASGGNWKDILANYGFAGTAYVISGLVGASSYATLAQLQTLRDAGWTIGSHCTSDVGDGGNNGLRTLGSRSAAYAEIKAGIDGLAVMGFDPDGLKHFALPQGGFDDNVLAACMDAGLKTIRGAQAPTHTTLQCPSGITGYRATTYNLTYRDPLNLPYAASIDTYTAANIKSEIDEAIRVGAAVCIYGHSINATTATKLDDICAYAKAKERQGLLDVVTCQQWHDSLSGKRA